jgi:hypothetical protein
MERLRQGKPLYKFRLFVPEFLRMQVGTEVCNLNLLYDRLPCRGGVEYFFRIKRERDWVSRHLVKEEFKG